MSKRKRVPSAAQRDKNAISIAKILKRKGALSKQTKLHGGKYISRAVLKKVQELRHVATPQYKAMKVPAKVAKAAKAEGYQVVGNRVIAPSNRKWERRFREAYERGEGLTVGVKPVRGGFMEEVTIPFSAKNVNRLIERLQTTSMDDLKLPDEIFAFELAGAGKAAGMSHRSFISIEQMRKYLENYKPDLTITSFKLFRLHPTDHDTYIMGPQRRKAARVGKVVKRGRRGEGESRIARLDRLNPAKAAKVRQEWKTKAAKKFAAIKSDPVKYEAFKAKARERMKAKRSK